MRQNVVVVWLQRLLVDAVRLAGTAGSKVRCVIAGQYATSNYKPLLVMFM